MKLVEFIKQPRSGRKFDVYQHSTPISSSMGEFAVELVGDTGKKSPPTDEMVAMASALAQQFRQDTSYLIGRVYKEYRRACRDSRWMEICAVEPGLSQEEFVRHVHGGSITIARDSIDSKYRGTVAIFADWDEEHGLYFEYRGSRWCKVEH